MFFFFPALSPAKKASEHQASMENLYLEIELTSRKYEKLGMVRLENSFPPPKKRTGSRGQHFHPDFQAAKNFHQTSIFVGV